MLLLIFYSIWKCHSSRKFMAKQHAFVKLSRTLPSSFTGTVWGNKVRTWPKHHNAKACSGNPGLLPELSPIGCMLNGWMAMWFLCDSSWYLTVARLSPITLPISYIEEKHCMNSQLMTKTARWIPRYSTSIYRIRLTIHTYTISRDIYHTVSFRCNLVEHINDRLAV